MITALDHIQLAIPKGAEDQVRPFYLRLGFVEVPKPDALAGRGGFWAQAGAVQLHIGVDPAFAPATKAHPCFVSPDIQALAKRLKQAGHLVKWDASLPDVTRFFTADPVGNRIEVMSA